MKTKTWVMLLGAVLVLCGALSLWMLMPGESAQLAEIWSDGELKYTLRLDVDQILTVESQNGTNVITIQDGKIAVTEADCPDHYCMNRGFCDSGSEIVCLPNRLVIRFLEEQSIDGAVG